MTFVDSNIPMYVAGRDHPLRVPAQRFLERARAGEVEICTSTEVLQEILYRYSALNRRDLAGAVYDLFVQFCPVVLPVTLADTDRARALVMKLDRVSVRDAVHAAVMLNHDIRDIATFDEGFDRVPGVSRLRLD
ncbi:MAG TPA: type II toxin-antitoxin system VapC family toxin [Vicinamibacterales bacterium]|nr:type II toxin-antitoxin system VapC family toxin [Vicinamibacterales bacterium]